MALTRENLDGTDPGDTVNIFVEDYGVSVTENEVWITVDGGNVGLLRLRSDKRLAKALVLLTAKGLCEMEKLSYDTGAA